MLWLGLLSGACGSGCYRSTVVPPAQSLPTSPAQGYPPGLSNAIPLQRSPQSPPHQIPSAAGSPWTPAATPRDWKSIVIHHTATGTGSVESIHAAHLRREDSRGTPWLGIGYHFVIGNGSGMGDGEIEPTFRWRTQIHGAHAGVEEHNQHGIGIALVGNFDKEPPTPAQLAAVKRLVGALKAEYGITSRDVIGHSDIRATACPGKYFPLDEISRSTPEVLVSGDW